MSKAGTDNAAVGVGTSLSGAHPEQVHGSIGRNGNHYHQHDSDSHSTSFKGVRHPQGPVASDES
jgi:hypothetical protein